MSWIDHLVELRKRLLWCLSSYGIALIPGYLFAPQIFYFLAMPLISVWETERRLIYTSLTEAFLTYLKIACFSAFVLSFPFMAMQVWFFIAPGLYKEERKYFLLLLITPPLLFLIGGALAYYGVCPLAWKFFISFENPGTQWNIPIQLEARVSEYLSLTLKLIMIFGLCFQLPLILIILTRLGIITLDSLKNNRKYAFLSIVIGSALITPPDIISPLSLTIPLYGFYELAILLGR